MLPNKANTHDDAAEQGTYDSHFPVGIMPNIPLYHEQAIPKENAPEENTHPEAANTVGEDGEDHRDSYESRRYRLRN